MKVALLEHDGQDASRSLLESTAATLITTPELPELFFALRKIGDRPGAMPGALLALLRGDFDIAHAFTAQDAAVAVAWSAITKRPVVYTQREPLSRANVADRRLRLATLRVALERSDAAVAPDEATAESLRCWMAVDPRVIAPAAAAEHVELWSGLVRR